MKTLKLVLALLGILGGAFVSPNLAAAPKAALTIVIPAAPRASEVEVASAEFAKYYEAIVGVRAEIAETTTPGVPFVKIGLPEKGDTFDPVFDSYRLKSVPGGVVLAGGNPRSTLYATYDFLARRGGCRWFWDGDVVPKKDALDLAGLDVYEVSRFEYRGLQYFAHRGLTRFEPEGWGFEDWKKEIDWCVKSRLNFIMLQIGMDDLFQKAFPEAVPYPDPAKTAWCDAPNGFDKRSPFWSLQYRGALRKKVLDYARARGLMHPAKFGTQTHWFSRTPKAFLDNLKPDFLAQSTGGYSERSGLIWDIRQKKWADAYWRLTEAEIENYGCDNLLFTPGFDERMCSTNRAENLRLKKKYTRLFIDEAYRRYPNAKVLIEGWDLHVGWWPEEIQEFLAELDPKRTIIWDYTADSKRWSGNLEIGRQKEINNITRWGIKGKFPYVFGIMLAYDHGTDIRADYPLIAERWASVKDDPMCKGVILWPETAHSDALAYRFLQDEFWRPTGQTTAARIEAFSRDRYGREAADYAAIWKKVEPLSRLADWRRMVSIELGDLVRLWNNDITVRDSAWVRTFGDMTNGVPPALKVAPEVFRALANLTWEKPFAQRDAMDLSRTTADRLIVRAGRELVRLYRRCKAGDKAALGELRKKAAAYQELGRLFAELLSLHTDYSLAESYERIDRIEHIRNPEFEKIFFANTGGSWYGRSHQYEFAAGPYREQMRFIAETLVARAEKGDFSPLPEQYPIDFYKKQGEEAHPIFAHRPTLPRTYENWWRVNAALADEAEIFVRAPAKVTVTQDHTNALYRVGESATFTVSVLDEAGKLASFGEAKWTLDNFGSVKLGAGTVDLAKGNPFTVRGELNEPGFLRLTVNANTNSVTWGVGYDVEKIRQTEPCPADFDAYWQGEKARLAQTVPLDAQCERVERLSRKEYDVYRVSFATFGGKRVKGFLSVPTDRMKAPFGVKVCVPGAGPGAPGPWHASATEISLLLNVHSYEPSWLLADRNKQMAEQNAALAKKFALPNPNAYCGLAGIAESREDYWYHDIMLGINRAIDWVCTRSDVDRSRVVYWGSSQGGGFGLFLTYLNEHIARSFVAVCAITGHYGFRQNRMDGWPKLIAGQAPAKRAIAERNAAYFDGVNFAARIRTPIRFVVGFADVTCPPACVYSAYNVCPSTDKAIVNAIGSGHGWARWYPKHRGIDCPDFDEWLRAAGSHKESASTIRILSPAADEVMTLLTPAQRDFLALSREERAAYFDDKRPDLEKKVTQIRSDPNPVILRWEGTGRFKVTVTKAGESQPVYEDTMRTNRAYIWNLEIGQRYEWSVTDGTRVGHSSFRTADEAPRLIRIPGSRLPDGKKLRGVPNFRDLGGRRTLSGRRIRQGRAYRAAGLNNNSNEKEKPAQPGSPRLNERWRLYLVKDLGIKTDIDLRSDRELGGMTTSPLGPEVRFVHDWENFRGYSAVHDIGREATIKVFRLFQQSENYPLVFHCIGGADRTGTVAALLEGILGVDEEEIRRDYQVTAWQGGVNDAKHLGWFERFVKSFDKFEGATLSERICAFFKSLGFTEEDLQQIRTNLLR